MDYEEQIEELREDLIRQVNQKCDSLLETYRINDFRRIWTE